MEQKLFDTSGRLRIPDLLVDSQEGFAATEDCRVNLTPRFSIFKQLFRCFAGAVADVNLPEGAIFIGPAVLAALTTPRSLPRRANKIKGVAQFQRTYILLPTFAEYRLLWNQRECSPTNDIILAIQWAHYYIQMQAQTQTTYTHNVLQRLKVKL